MFYTRYQFNPFLYFDVTDATERDHKTATYQYDDAIKEWKMKIAADEATRAKSWLTESTKYITPYKKEFQY